VRARAYVVLACALGAACASSPWPDERGVAVPVSYAENARAVDAFLEALTAARAGTTLPAPRVTPRFEPRVRRIAEALQAGEASAPAALENARRWGAAAFGRPVEAWLFDCRPGARPSLPRALTSPPVVSIAFAAAHFRPRSWATEQCALVVVDTGGVEQVRAVGPAAPR